MAIWSEPTEKAALLCLEPCTSIHPGTYPSLYLEDRDGIIILPPGQCCQKEFTIAFS